MGTPRKPKKDYSPNWGGRRPNSGAKGKTKKATKSDVALVHAQPIAASSKTMSVSMINRIIEASKSSALGKTRNQQHNPFQLPQFPPQSMPKDKKLRMAMDQNLSWAENQWATANGYPPSFLASEGLQFFGYPYLAELAQRPEYRVISETIADDATRKWIDFELTGDEKEKKKQTDDPGTGPSFSAEKDERDSKLKAAGKTDKVKAIQDEMVRLEARDRFYTIAVQDGLFGRSHLFINFGEDLDNPAVEDELKTPIGDGRDEMSKGKIKKGSLESLRTVEPVWVYPTTYNAVNPLKDNWYNPDVWWVLGKQVHRSRLPVFVGHPVPDLLKPAYSFGGLSLSQMAKPYVDIWLQTRQSVADLIHSFSIMVLSTDLQATLQQSAGGAGGLIARAEMFTALRDNQGLMMVNKATEDFKNVSASLAGLHELQAQAQEHMASVSRIPLVKLTGISPTGLNASSEGEIRAYYDTIAAYQNRFFRPHLTRVLNFIQLSLFGEIDPEITWNFEPLWEMSQKEKSEKEKDDADRDQTYVDMGAFAPAEIRKIKIDDPTLPYTGLDPDDLPDLDSEEEGGLEPEGGRPDPKAGAEPDKGGGEAGEAGGNDASDHGVHEGWRHLHGR
jgi:uncharacterized protein